ncbi:hypothetical protein D3C85_1646780 [compost metagenome]
MIVQRVKLQRIAAAVQSLTVPDQIHRFRFFILVIRELSVPGNVRVSEQIREQQKLWRIEKREMRIRIIERTVRTVQVCHILRGLGDSSLLQ